MSDVLLDSMDQLDADSEATIERLFAEMERMNEQIRKDQTEIDRLRSESNSLGTESAQLIKEARARLTRLHEALDQISLTNEPC